jgi:hypothetical protein
MKEQMASDPIIVDDFNIPLSSINRSSRLKE